MPEPGERFGSLSRTRVPDLWPEIEGREPGNPIEPSSARRVLVAVVAFVVATVGIGFAAVSFGGSERPAASGATGPVGVANGPIYFRVGGGDGGSHIEAVEPDGSEQRVVFEGEPMRIAQVAWSPDATRIAFQNPIADERGIFVANPDGSGVVRLTEGANDAWPSWSPEGTRILFSSTRYDLSIELCEPGADFRCPRDVYLMDADGTNIIRLTSGDAPEYQPVWSPDGRRIAFVRSTGGTGGEAPLIFTMNADGSDIQQVSSGDGGSDFSPSWSPDGSEIVFLGFRFEDTGIWIAAADGSEERRVLGGGWYSVDDPVWSPAGDLIAFVGSPEGGEAALDDELYVMRPDGTNVRQIADAPGIGVAGDIAWQPIQMPAETVEPSPPPPISELLSVHVRVTATHGVAEFPTAVAAGDGVWVTAQRQDGSGAGDVIRLSPDTGEVMARVEVRAAPGWEVGGAGITVANGSVWVVGEVGWPDQKCCHALVTRIDPSTNEIIDEIELPGDQDFGNDVWVDGDAMYVLMFVDGASSLELAKVEIEGHTTVWRVPVPGQWSQTVFVAGGSVWVLGTQPEAHGPVEVDTLYRIDPGTGTVIDQVPLPYASSAYIPSVAPETVWFRTNDGMQRFDTTSSSLVGAPVGPGPGCCGGAAFVSDGSGGVWVVSSAGADVEGSIWHIDPSGTIVASGTISDRQDFEDMHGQSYAFDPATQTIWVQHYEDSVSRVEIVVPVNGS